MTDDARTPDGRPIRVRLLPAHLFPYTVELLDGQSGKVCWSTVVEGPGVLEVPRLGLVSVVARVSYADGDVAESWSFTCPQCGTVSHSERDARAGYCGACRDWTDGGGEGTRTL